MKIFDDNIDHRDRDAIFALSSAPADGFSDVVRSLSRGAEMARLSCSDIALAFDAAKKIGRLNGGIITQSDRIGVVDISALEISFTD